MPAVQHALAEYIAALDASRRSASAPDVWSQHDQYLADAGVLLARAVRGDLPANLLEGLKMHDRLRISSPLPASDHTEIDSAWERLIRLVPAVRPR